MTSSVDLASVAEAEVWAAASAFLTVVDSYRLYWTFTLLDPRASLTCAGIAARRLDAHVLVLGYCRDRASELSP